MDKEVLADLMLEDHDGHLTSTPWDGHGFRDKVLFLSHIDALQPSLFVLHFDCYLRSQRVREDDVDHLQILSPLEVLLAESAAFGLDHVEDVLLADIRRQSFEDDGVVTGTINLFVAVLL